MRGGYTVFELLVTVLIVTVLATSVGIFFVKLLTLQEKDRDEAYVREKLADLSAEYADFASIGSSFSIDSSGRKSIISYRHETGGVSFETGRVSRVAYLTMATTNLTMDLDVYSFSTQTNAQNTIFANVKDGLISAWMRFLQGDPSLIVRPTRKLDVKKVNCTITPLEVGVNNASYLPDGSFSGFNVYSNAAIGNLKVTAWYAYENSRKESVLTNATVERLVRLWNHQ